MDPYTTNGGSSAQQQSDMPPYNDPNPTRYIPPEETPRPEVPGSSYGTGNGSNGSAGTGNAYQPSGQASPQGTYQQPNTNGAPPSYQSINQTTTPYSVTPAQRRDRDRSLLAMILIGAGVLFLLGQFTFFPGFGDIVLLLIGGIFLYAYFSTKPAYRIGFLIPGAILTGIGVGTFLQNLPGIDLLFGGNIVAITLGLGFCAIWFFDRRHWWSLIPGGIILLGGLSSLFRVGALWPIILIGLGIYLLYEQTRKRA
jgi:hypothetical protein